MRWDPDQYLKFADDRGRPFQDLIARVTADNPAAVVDLGCGPGNLTRALAARWPGARVEGLDASPEMITRARSGAGADPTDAGDGAGTVDFRVGDLRHWTPGVPVDVIVSNATLQWVPEHLDLLERLTGFLRPAGWLAFQVPANFDAPTHTELADLLAAPRWRDRLSGVEIPRGRVEEPGTYLARLAALGLRPQVWETTYLHVLPGDNAVLEWMRGTGLRPVLAALSPAEGAELEDEFGGRLRLAYPPQEFGTVLPFRRIFAAAQRPGQPA
jgi:trans-aconitate 2-methyltransferase